ncbi:MAG: LytR C-terminal domain-containing protein [bacterium]
MKRVFKDSPEVDIKTSTFNMFLNIAIFLLAGLIIYMGYSLFIKLSNRDNSELENVNNDVASEIIQAEIQNGCGVSGVADRFTDYLRKNDIDIVGSGNYISFDIDETMIIDRIGNKANAEKIAGILGVNKKNVIQQLNDDYFLDVSVIIGKDYFKLNPLKEGF